MRQDITAKTGFMCVLGSPIKHSISPAMHNEAINQLGLDYAYMGFDVDESTLPQTVEGLKAMNARGWNLTFPCKNLMATLCDELSPASQISGAVNTVVNDNGKLIGYTTDGIGYMKAALDNGHDLRGKVMTILGAGGAATAIIIQAALDGVKEIRVFNLKDAFWDRAQEIIDKCNEMTDCKVTLHELPDEQGLKDSIADSYILLNATNVGMAPNTDRCIITDTSVFRADLVVSDVIYNPEETKLLKMAKEAGCQTFNGLYMLLYQGAASFKLWTGEDMPVDIVKEKHFKR